MLCSYRPRTGQGEDRRVLRCPRPRRMFRGSGPRGFMLRKFIPNTILLKSFTRILREHFQENSLRKSFSEMSKFILKNFKIIFPKRFSKMVAKMLCNSSKLTRIGFDVFLKIEKCQAFCRGRTCTVGKYKWFFGGSAGGRGIPAPSPGRSQYL